MSRVNRTKRNNEGLVSTARAEGAPRRTLGRWEFFRGRRKSGRRRSRSRRVGNCKDALRGAARGGPRGGRAGSARAKSGRLYKAGRGGSAPLSRGPRRSSEAVDDGPRGNGLSSTTPLALRLRLRLRLRLLRAPARAGAPPRRKRLRLRTHESGASEALSSRDVPRREPLRAVRPEVRSRCGAAGPSWCCARWRSPPICCPPPTPTEALAPKTRTRRWRTTTRRGP